MYTPHLTSDGRNIGRPRVAHGHGRVIREQQRRHRFPDNVRATQHDRVLAGHRHAGALQQLNAPERRARDQRRALRAEQLQRAGVLHVQTVHVLGGRDGGDDDGLVQVRGQRELCGIEIGKGNKWARIE